ncbi:MAG: hypothetical protein IBJ11_07910, partial [Phycisphaerales bacterium]|nr:hypothetical protein [Phycisphaerales bacterium]
MRTGIAVIISMAAWVCAGAWGGGAALAQMAPLSVYAPVNRPAMVKVSAAAGEEGQEAPLEVRLHAPGQEGPVAVRRVRTGEVDLGSLFPVLFRPGPSGPRVLYAQLYRGGKGLGPPVVIEPLVPRPHATDGLTARVMEAFEKRDAAGLSGLLAMPASKVEELRRAVVRREGVAGGGA